MDHFLDQSAEQLRAWLAEHGQPAYRASQVRRWLCQRRAETFDEMSDLPREARTGLAEAFALWTTRIAAHRKAGDGTEKLLLELADGQRIECVLLRDDRGHCSVCLSTQVGCAMGCAFCATGMDGVERNLTTGEIIEQILRLQRLLHPDERLSHVVVMGMGEPLANLDRLLPALALATSRSGLGISVRRVTISTVGLPAGIRRLAEMNCPYHLAVSLHTADDALRDRLVPANRNVGIAAILAAADAYFAATARRVTFEYVLLGGVNDREEDAAGLIGLLRRRSALVNVIPYNPVPGLPFRAPAATATNRFVETLTRGGLTVALRHRKGERIDAACGQLRRKSVESGERKGLGIGD
jgi:23S rRNA (adenine2503-C2)-methyltransferase